MLVRRAFWFGRAASGVVAAAVVFTAAALASPGASERAVKEGGTFRVGMPADHGRVDRSGAHENLGTGQLLNATCASLVNFPDKPLPAGLRLAPEVAAGYTVSRDGRTYAFTIRKGLRFSTGAPVTAQDFAASINRLLNPSSRRRLSNRSHFSASPVPERVLDGNAETASGITVRRGRARHPAHEGRNPTSCPQCGSCVLPRRSRQSLRSTPKASAPRSRAPAPTSSPSTSLVSGSCSSATASTVEPTTPRRPLRRRRSTATRTHCSTRSSAGSSTTRSRQQLDRRARASARKQVRRNRGQFWIESELVSAHVCAQHLPPALPEQPEAEAGRELRRRPRRACARTAAAASSSRRPTST